MADPVELMLGDLTDKYAKKPASDAFMRLYTDDERFGRIFASLHERLNDHFVAINDRARSTRHYWADNSRALIALIDELAETIMTLRRGTAESQQKVWAEYAERASPTQIGTPSCAQDRLLPIESQPVMRSNLPAYRFACPRDKPAPMAAQTVPEAPTYDIGNFNVVR